MSGAGNIFTTTTLTVQYKQVMFFDTYMILEKVKYCNLDNSSTVTLLMYTRDHGTEQTKSTDVIHNTRYVPQPSFTEEIHQQTPCGNRLFLKAKHICAYRRLFTSSRYNFGTHVLGTIMANTCG